MCVTNIQNKVQIKGRPKKTHVDLLEGDTGYALNEVENSIQYVKIKM